MSFNLLVVKRDASVASQTGFDSAEDAARMAVEWYVKAKVDNINGDSPVYIGHSSGMVLNQYTMSVLTHLFIR